MDRNPQNIKEKFTSKPTGNQTHYHCEAPEIKLKTHPKFTHHREAHDAGLTKPHHATPMLTFNLATVACLKEDDREVREEVWMKTEIELEGKKKKKLKLSERERKQIIKYLSKLLQYLSRPKSMEHEFRYMTILLNLHNLLNIINPQ